MVLSVTFQPPTATPMDMEMRLSRVPRISLLQKWRSGEFPPESVPHIMHHHHHCHCHLMGRWMDYWDVLLRHDADMPMTCMSEMKKNILVELVMVVVIMVMGFINGLLLSYNRGQYWTVTQISML